MEADLRQAASVAVERLDRAHAEHPNLEHEDVRAAVNAVIDFRDKVLVATRQGRADRGTLDRANSVVSLAYGAEFPLVGLPRERLAQARDAMAALASGEPFGGAP